MQSYAARWRLRGTSDVISRRVSEKLRAIIADVRRSGITSVRHLAEELNRRDILTARGGE
jgi:hypothetical protein